SLLAGISALRDRNIFERDSTMRRSRFVVSTTHSRRNSAQLLRRRTRRLAQPRVEPLEDRRLLALSVLPINVNPGSANSNPRDFMEFGGKVYFSAERADVGNELFRIDQGQPVLVDDAVPGIAASYPGDMTAYKNAIYMRAFDPTHGSELFRYDGTTRTLVADIDPTT